MSQKITQNLKTLRNQIRKKGKPNQTIKLVAVTKTRAAEQESEAIEAGVFINAIESFSYGRSNDETAQLALDSYGRVADGNKRDAFWRGTELLRIQR